jgi:hypothetical protein
MFGGCNEKLLVTGHRSLMSRFKLLRLRRSFIGNSIGRPLIGDGRFCDQLMLSPPICSANRPLRGYFHPHRIAAPAACAAGRAPQIGPLGAIECHYRVRIFLKYAD